MNIFELEKIYILGLSSYIDCEIEKNKRNAEQKKAEINKVKKYNILLRRYKGKKLSDLNEFHQTINKVNYDMFQQIIKLVNENKFIENKRLKNDFKIYHKRFLKDIPTPSHTINETIDFFKKHYPVYLNVELYHKIMLSDNFVKLYYSIEDILKQNNFDF